VHDQGSGGGPDEVAGGAARKDTDAHGRLPATGRPHRASRTLAQEPRRKCPVRCRLPGSAQAAETSSLEQGLQGDGVGRRWRGDLHRRAIVREGLNDQARD
jgi:hypothetical protein